MRILALADRRPKIVISEVIAEHNIDLVVTLGDFERTDLLQLSEITDIPKLGVYGNHCSGTYMEDLGIINMHMATISIGGLVFGGFEGCVRYKENPQAIMYTQEEASAMLSHLPPVDILLCHCPPRGINDEDEVAHQGFEGLRTYLNTTPPKMLMHGHTYPSEQEQTKQYGETRIEYVHEWKIIET